MWQGQLQQSKEKSTLYTVAATFHHHTVLHPYFVNSHELLEMGARVHYINTEIPVP